jgi:pimeloyl-ACP methyl ester carboxylesterase
VTELVARRIVEVPQSPLAPGASPVRLSYRDAGAGEPLVILHGGWGYDIYSFDRQSGALAATNRIIAPDRTGYGQSGPIARQEVDFHVRAARETLALLESLGIDRPTVWGHSDGAVIAFHMALGAPQRVAGIVAEATHFYRDKPASRAFFETMRDDPVALGARVADVLSAEHGGRWEALIRTNGDAWLRIAEQRGDLYDGRLGNINAPVLLVHGARDPRTEPGEFDALVAALRGRATICMFPDGGHSPHSERPTASAVTACVTNWLRARAAD